MVDNASWLAGTRRNVEKRSGAGKSGYDVILRRHFDVPVERLWETCTSPAHLNEFFLPVSGDLKLGGNFLFKGNAGGDILECDAPHSLRVTWVYGDMAPNEVSLRLQQDGEGSTLEMRHADPSEETSVVDHVFAVGVGWDPALFGFGSYLDGEKIDQSAWMASPDSVDMIKRSVRAWEAVLIEGEFASREAIEKGAAAAIAFYTGETPNADDGERQAS